MFILATRRLLNVTDLAGAEQVARAYSRNECWCEKVKGLCMIHDLMLMEGKRQPIV